MGFTASTTQAFQYSLPYQQVFNAATSALQAVKKATLTGADMNARFMTFETPFSFTSYGERFVVGFIPNEQGVIVEVPAPRRACRTSCRMVVTASKSRVSWTPCPASCRARPLRSPRPDLSRPLRCSPVSIRCRGALACDARLIIPTLVRM